MMLRDCFAWLLPIAGATVFSTAAGAADPRFYPIESFTIVSALEGMNRGTRTMHVTDWGRKHVTIEETTLSIMGVTQTAKRRVIVDGRDVTTIDEQAKTVSRTVNPLYDGLARGVEGKDPQELGRSFMTALGHEPTDRRGEFAGEDCGFWTNPQLGQELCVTDDGIVVRTVTKMMGMNLSETATAVRRDDPGPAAAYDVPDYPVSATPNLRDLLKGGR